MPVTPTRATARTSDPRFVHLNVRLLREQADHLRSRADDSLLDVSKIVRALIVADMERRTT